MLKVLKLCASPLFSILGLTSTETSWRINISNPAKSTLVPGLAPRTVPDSELLSAVTAMNRMLLGLNICRPGQGPPASAADMLRLLDRLIRNGESCV